MVFLHVKRDKEVQFYIETPAVTPVSKVAAQAAGMHNLIRRIQRICAEGARFAERVLQSSEAEPDHKQDDSDDEADAADGDSSSTQQTASADAAAAVAENADKPLLEGDPVTQPPVRQAGGDSAAATATVKAADHPGVTAPSQHIEPNSAGPTAGCADDTAAAAADSHRRDSADLPDVAAVPATDTPPITASAAACAAAETLETTEARGADEAAVAPPAVSEADEQFETLCRALLAASKLIAAERAAQRQLLTMGELQDAVRGIQAAATDLCLSMAPGGDSLRSALATDSAPVEPIHADILPDTTVLWVANRKLDNAKTLAAEVGRNDKTRVTVTVQHAREPAPPKSLEPPPEEYEEMLAFYYKWQEKDKRLEADMDLGFYNSQWADPRSLKQSLSGIGSVTMPKHGPRGFN